MQLLGSSKKDIDQNKDGVIVPKLETAEVVLVHCNLANNHYQQASKILFTSVPNKQFGQLITIKPHAPNNRPLEIKDNANITLTIRTG